MNVYIPRLAHGDGGLVQLTFSSDQYSDSPQPAGYTVSTRYDQGSWRIDSSTPNRITIDPNANLTIALLALLIGIISFTFPYLSRKSKKLWYDNLAGILAREILIENKKKLNDEPYCEIPIRVDSRNLKKIFYNDEQDYNKVKNYYSTLSERNGSRPTVKSPVSAPTNNQNLTQFYQLNGKLNQCADKVLNEVDWARYNIDILHIDGQNLDPFLMIRPYRILNRLWLIIGFAAGILVPWSVTSCLVSRDPLHWTVKFEVIHGLVVLAVLIFFVVYLVRIFRLLKIDKRNLYLHVRSLAFFVM